MQVTQLVEDVNKLVSLPEVCTRIHQMLEDPRFTSKDIGHVLSQDVDLTARLLKIVNSSFYGFPAKIDTIKRAITVIGNSELLVLVLATSSVMTFKNIPADLMNMATFWRHSVYTGVIARLMATKCNVLHSERLFVAGLLHDIGKLVILYKLPDEAREVLDAVNNESEKNAVDEDYLTEEKILGFNHAEVGMEMLKVWNLPESLQISVGMHHTPSKAENFQLESAIVHVSNVLASCSETNMEITEMLPYIDKDALSMTGLSEDDIEPILNEATPKFNEALELILPAAYRN